MSDNQSTKKTAICFLLLFLSVLLIPVHWNTGTPVFPIIIKLAFLIAGILSFIIKKKQLLVITTGVIATISVIWLILLWMPFFLYKIASSLSYFLFDCMPIILPHLSVIFIFVIALLHYLNKENPVIYKLWFLPAALYVVLLVTLFILEGDDVLDCGYLSVGHILFFISTSIFLHQFCPKEESLPNFTQSTSLTYSKGYSDILSHSLLITFVGFIYIFIWIHKVTKFLNSASNFEYRKPACKVALSIFIPFYMIYWFWQSALRIDEMYESKGLKSNSATLITIISVICPFMAPIFLQSIINRLCILSSSKN